ncbi:hypothetical protein PT974_01293 [Cladobotryum mycophilum]|uniref:non-specific serine/threonine protein kinase n=1 Tax=Cladobotryum mycophilum TaxID=491253 RepID=A0ABR0T3A1_9HYPO
MSTSIPEVIQVNPIGNALDGVHHIFDSECQKADILCTPESLSQLGPDSLRNIASDLILSLMTHKASHILPSCDGAALLIDDLSKLLPRVRSNDFDRYRICSLLEMALGRHEDTTIWDKVYEAVKEYTPPPTIRADSSQQTPTRTHSGTVLNSSENRVVMDRFLKQELRSLYVDVPGFHEAFFGNVPNLNEVSEAVFRKCQDNPDPLFQNGWRGWPQDASENRVLQWFAGISDTLAAFAEMSRPNGVRRRPLAKPTKPLAGTSPAERKLDVAFVSDPEATTESEYHWSKILIAGELKKNVAGDTASNAWFDLARYMREIFAHQDNRRFVLGFTLCGPLMRVWEFDRLGGIGSSQFDINTDGLRFVKTMLAFFWLNDEQLGFDPTIQISSDGQRYIDIRRQGQQETERIILDECFVRTRCIAGRATTCWRAHRKGDGQQLVIKDSWQYTEREEEGELLRLAADAGVVNVARYHYHETVVINGIHDDVHNGIRNGLDVSKGTKYGIGRPARSNKVGLRVKAAQNAWSVGKEGSEPRSRSSSRKRSADDNPAGETPTKPPSKKRSVSSKDSKMDTLSNRIHRRVFVRDYGKPIYKATSIPDLLGALIGCINGHRSLYRAGLLHRDISINNLIINEAERDPLKRGYLIDLDLAISLQRLSASGAEGKTGTRAFMAIGALDGKQHSFMHDLESFFWVLFWISVHYDGSRHMLMDTNFHNWNYDVDATIGLTKRGLVSAEDFFLDQMAEHVTEHYQPMIPCINGLRKVVFPNGQPRKDEKQELYDDMIQVLCKAREAFEPLRSTK